MQIGSDHIEQIQRDSALLQSQGTLTPSENRAMILSAAKNKLTRARLGCNAQFLTFHQIGQLIAEAKALLDEVA